MAAHMPEKPVPTIKICFFIFDPFDHHAVYLT